MKRLSKLIAVIAALTLVLGMSVSVFAEDLSETEIKANIAESQVEYDGNVEVNDITEKVVVDFINDLRGNDEKKAAAAQKALKDVLADLYEGTDYTIDEDKDLEVIGTFDLHIEDYEPGSPITVDISDMGLEDWQDVYVFHWNEKEEAWEVCVTWVDPDGTITFGFDSTSPFLITVASDGTSLLIIDNSEDDDVPPTVIPDDKPAGAPDDTPKDDEGKGGSPYTGE